jgi:hypothetical protein
MKGLLLEKANMYGEFEKNEFHTEIIKNILKQIYEIEEIGSNQNEFNIVQKLLRRYNLRIEDIK